jgi:iron complex transport system permease protein
MSTKNKNLLLLIGALAAILLLFGLYLKTGTIHTPWSSVLGALFSNDLTNENHVVIQSFRLPRILMAFLAGSALSVAGMFMQNLFQNTLAGPDILGITSGSSLLVAFWMMTGMTVLGASTDLILLGIFGAMGMGVVMLLFALKLRSAVHLLLIGIMASSFIGAVIAIIQASSGSQDLQQYVFWNFGSLQRVNLEQIPWIALVLFSGIILSISQLRALNAMVLGEEAAKSLGISIRKFRIMSILISGLLTGTITAFAGPIAFVGLAIPNVTKLLMKTQNHRILLFSNVLFGALFLGICDFVIVLFEATLSIPLNALTALLGVPFVGWMILKNRHVTG